MRTTVLACALASALTASTPSAAQTNPDAGAHDTTPQVRDFHTEADAQYARGDYSKAYPAYLAAWSIAQDYELAEKLGTCEVELGNYRDAAEHLAYFLREYPTDKPAGHLEKTRQLFEQARSRIATIHVTTETPGTKILVDGDVIGESPMQAPLYLDPGSHLLEARRGPIRTKVRIAVTPGLTRWVDLRPHAVALTPKAPAPPARTLPRTANTKNDEPQTKLALVVAGAATTVAGVGTGIVFSNLSHWQHDNVDARTTQLESSARLRSLASACAGAAPYDNQCNGNDMTNDLHRRYGAVSTLGFVMGAAGAAATLTFALLPMKAGGAPVQVTTMLAPNAPGFTVRGHF